MRYDPGEDWAGKYPNLFRPHPHSWGGVTRDYTVQLTLTPQADDLVVNTRLIAVEDKSGGGLYDARGLAHAPRGKPRIR